jgi:hypothetical protein
MKISAVAVVYAVCGLAAAEPPAIPLVTHDPYFSVWSMRGRLTDDWPRHWNGDTMGMSGLVRVDGKAYRWCGTLPQGIPAAEQVSVDVGLTATTYVFDAGPARVTVQFDSMMGMATSLSQVSESITAVEIGVEYPAGGSHEAQVYLDLSGEWCTGSDSESVVWSTMGVADLKVATMARAEQPVLGHACDRCTINWGRIHLATESGRVAVGPHDRSRGAFAETGAVTDRGDLRMPRAANDNWPVIAASSPLEAGKPVVFLLGYDESRAIEFFERPLRPLWHATHGDDFGARLIDAMERSRERGATSDAEAAFVAEAERVGGADYAKLVKLAYRQVLAGHKIVADWDGAPLMFSKENTSNGCIGTVDVIYPASPFFLYHNPEMLKAQLKPLMDYAASPRWRFNFAPHDLGTYPKANGQVYGGGERTEENQMPVEESGNMIIMLAALAKVEGSAAFSEPYLGVIGRWAEYLREHGLDPEHQLCTDDFAGHLARNANLSAKTCVALGAYAQLLKAAGREDESAKWREVAERFAVKWLELAEGADATVLVFGAKSGETWSQKYNLVWDRALGLGLFPAEVMDREVRWYKGRLNRYGLPLDSRRTYTKLDWTVWSACLTGRRSDFEGLMGPVYGWMQASPPPSRVPLSDWYETMDGKTMGMHTRTVVGGVWMPLLMEKLGAGLR